MFVHVLRVCFGPARLPPRNEQSPRDLPGDGWGGMTASLDPEIARFTSLVDASGPSPSSVVDELRAREADLEEDLRGPSRELARRDQKLIAFEQRDVFGEAVGGSASINTDSTSNTDSTTNTDTDSNATNELSATATPSSSVGGLREEKQHTLREEKRYLRKRIKMYNELTRQLLRVIDRRQTAAEEDICRLEEAMVVCNVSPPPPFCFSPP